MFVLSLDVVLFFFQSSSCVTMELWSELLFSVPLRKTVTAASLLPRSSLLLLSRPSASQPPWSAMVLGFVPRLIECHDERWQQATLRDSF